MALAAKKQIERLLADLDVTDSGGVEAAVAAAAGNSEVEDLLASLHAAGRVAGRREADMDSEQGDTCSTVTDDQDQDHGRPRPSNRSDQFLYLERKVLQLMSDNKALSLALEQTARRKDSEISELHNHLTKVVREVEERQRELEARAPLMRLKIDDFRSQLHDLRISDARYSELKSMPADSLHIVDEVKMAVYEGTAVQRQDNERLRLSIAAGREAQARAEEEAAALRLQHARLSAGIVEKEQELQAIVDGLQSRTERLASELEAAVVRSELLSAKGQMYDEVRAKVNKLTDENQRLQVVEANAKRLEYHNHELQMVTKQKEHSHEMLVTDKAYLSQQVEFLAEAQRRLQSELEVRDAKVAELTRQKADLFDKLVQTETLKNKQEDSKLQRELSQLQTSTQASIERIRTETGEAYEREARLLRELRDQAQEDAMRTKVALKDLQGMHEQHQIHAAELQRRLEQQAVELQTELRQRAFELSHLNVVVGEKESVLQRTTMQLELIQSKLQASMDRCRTLDAEASARQYQNNHNRNEGAGPAPFTQSLEHMQAAADVVTELAELRSKLRTLTSERDQLTAQVVSLQAALTAAQGGLRMAGQPHAFLLEQLQGARTAAQQAEVRSIAIQTALKAKEQEVVSVVAERDEVRTDLDLLLQQRGHLDSLKTLLMRTLGAGQAAPPPPWQQQGGAPRPAARPTTIITGSGGG